MEDALLSLLLSRHRQSLAVSVLRWGCSPSGSALMADDQLMWIHDSNQAVCYIRHCLVYCLRYFSVTYLSLKHKGAKIKTANGLFNPASNLSRTLILTAVFKVFPRLFLLFDTEWWFNRKIEVICDESLLILFSLTKKKGFTAYLFS